MTTPAEQHSDGWVYDEVKVVRVVDGDTVDLELTRDIGFYHRSMVTLRFRLIVVNTPERGEANWGNATAFTRNWLYDHAANLLATTYKHDSTSPIPDGGFGRWLVGLSDMVTGETLHQALLDAGLGVPYVRGG